MLHVTNDAGRRFEVRCVRKGERYGLNNCLTHERDDPLIEFIDMTPAGGLLADGLFVARYPVQAFLQRDEHADLWLYGKDVAWRLSPAQVRQVQEWIVAEGCTG